jgi:hypothetical protein
MADEHRHAHAGRGELDLGIENLLGLDQHLPLFLGVTVESMNTSMCGMTLKAICLVNFFGVGESVTKMPLVCDHNSSRPSLPAPDTDW